MKQFPIAITGMHRTGTSMVTRALHDSGLRLLGDGDEAFIDAAEDNPEGFWEHKAIVACNDNLLEATGGAWDHPPALPPQGTDDPRVAHLVGAASEVLAGLRAHERWGFKDPRTCLTAAFWLDLEPELRFVICLRHPIEVALSLKRRNQNSYSLGLTLWERYYATVLDVVPPDRRIVTHYDAFFADPAAELARLGDFAGLEPAEPRVRGDLRHHTAAVSLEDAGVSDTVRDLYASLCREAGVVLAPEAPPDEGRVRRLVLDGAVAARHAEQRQAAIERLQEREAEHISRIHTLEAKVRELERSARHNAAIEARLAQLDHLLQSVGKQAALAAQGGPVERRLRRLAGGAARRARRVVRGRPPLVGPTVRKRARIVVRRLPPPAQRVVRRGVATARQPRKEGPRTARAVARRLPPPARRALVRSRAVARRTASLAAPPARAAARRLPPPLRTRLRRAGSLVRGRTGRDRHRRRAEARAKPRGASPRQWRGAYEQLVREVVPPDRRWLVALPGSPAEVRLRQATPFPAPDGRPLPDDLAHVARLEALRFQGHDLLVVPEGSRSWFGHRAELREHLTATYRTVADRPGAGIVVDLRQAPEPGTASLRAEVRRLAAGLAHEPAVLDWTASGVDGELAGLTTFRPPPGHRLPYLDASIDIVVTDADHDAAEATRVATRGVVTVEQGGTRVLGVSVNGHGAGSEDEPAPRTLVWSADDPANPGWAEALRERAAAAGADIRLAPLDADGIAALDGAAEVVVVVEPHVLPLPGTIATAAALAAADPGCAVAGKVLTADGRVESAGGTVFADRSVGLVAHGASETRAPWHDYVRPVCWAPGILAAAAPLWHAVPPPQQVAGRGLLREWCSGVWSSGAAVRYHPSVVAVRVDGDGCESDSPLPGSGWQRVLDLRPPRPKSLGDGAWRHLLACDDVEACRA